MDNETQPKYEAAKSDEAKQKTYHAAICEQHQDEFKVGTDFILPWRVQKRDYLKLYINQRKNMKKVGDTLMFSTHQTILAALYKDHLNAEWMMREEEDEERVDMINALWEFDYDEMGKPEHDYDKFWDASFYGIALEDWSHFDRPTLTPIPSLWDPLVTVFDPDATKINGNRRGEGKSRFIYREIGRMMEEMKGNSSFMNLKELDPDSKAATELKQTKEARDAARGTSTQPKDILKNKHYIIRQGYTLIDGKLNLVEFGNQGNTLVRLTPIKTDYMPLQESRIYPEPHQLLTPGTPDFTEDKQRARAILQNATLDAAKFDVHPEWLFDKNKIKNKAQLREHKSGKYIEVDGDVAGAAMPLQKPSVQQYVQGIMQELETNAQKALATPEIQQGILFAQKRSATEINEASSNVDSRYSLTASLFAISEHNAAIMWLDQYKSHYKEGIDKKTVRIVGAFGPKFMPLVADHFKFTKDPDVKIESRVISEGKKRDQRNQMVNYANILLSIPGANMRAFAKDMGRLMFSKPVVERYLPDTIDEMKAEKENDALNANTIKGVVIDPTDDHDVHLNIHSKAADTKAKFAHIEAHKKAKMIQRQQPELFQGVMPPTPAVPGTPIPNQPVSANAPKPQLTP